VWIAVELGVVFKSERDAGIFKPLHVFNVVFMSYPPPLLEIIIWGNKATRSTLTNGSKIRIRLLVRRESLRRD